MGLRLIALVLVCAWSSTLCAQPAVNACHLPDQTIPPNATSTSTLEVVDDVTIAELNVALNLSHTWVGTFQSIQIESPTGTTVLLQQGGGGFTSDFDCVYSDIGRVNTGDVDSGGGVPSAYDCGGCLMQPAEGGDGELADFRGEGTAGEWTLRMTATESSFGAGNLNRWCVTAYESPPVTNLVCEPHLDDPDDPDDSFEEGILSFSWINGASYEMVRVYHFGDLIAEVAGDFAEGEPSTFTIDEPLAVPQIGTFRVAGVVDDIESAPNECTASLTATPIECVSGTDFPLSASEWFLELVSFTEEATIGDVTVDLDVTYPFVGELQMLVTSAAGTSVFLLRQSQIGENLNVKFWELGEDLTGGPSATGRVVRPTGPGSLADFAGESTLDPASGDSTWALAVVGANSGGAVNRYELCVFDVPPPLPPTDISCSPGAELATATVSWVNGADYDEIRVTVNGDLTVLSGPFAAGAGESFVTAMQPLPSQVSVCVQGIVPGGAPTPRACCSQLIVLPPVESLGCLGDGDTGKVLATWVNPGFFEYDFINVFVNGTLVEVLADGSATAFETAAFPLPSIVTVGIQGGLGAPAVLSRTSACRAQILPPVDFQACNLGVTGPSGETLESTVTFLEAVTVEQVEVTTDITSAFFGNVFITVTSPSDVEVMLHEAAGPDFQSDTLVRWRDDGVGAETLSDAEWNEGLIVAPQGPGALADFENQALEGEWRLTIAANGFQTTINSWCVRVDGCPALPPSDLLCTPTDDSVLLEWLNNDSYDEIRVEESGVVIATLGGGTESFEAGGLDTGRYKFQVFGFSAGPGADCQVGSGVCEAAIGFLSTCASGIEVAPGGVGDPELVSLFVDSSFAVGAVEVALDLNTPFTSDWRIDLVSPFGTRVELHDQIGVGSSLEEPFDLIWSESPDARPNGAPFDCDGCLMQPAGDLSDLIGEIADGEWNVSFAGKQNGVVNRVCVDLYPGCPVEPPLDVSCEPDGADVILSWTNGGGYDSIRIERNGSVVASGLAGTATSYTDDGVLAGFYTYRVFGESSAADCAGGSRPCKAVKDVVDFCNDSEQELVVGATSIQVVDVPDDIPVDDLHVEVDLSSGFFVDYTIWAVNPEGTRTTLYNDDPPLQDEGAVMSCVYADSGVVQPVESYACGDCLIRPKGPGTLGDLTTGSSAGEWELEILSLSNSGTLENVCMRFFVACDIARPEITSCTSAGGGGLPPVELSWTGTAGAAGVIILRDDVSIAELEPGETSYMDFVDVPGRPVYRVASVTSDGCVRASRGCESDAIGRFTDCVTPALFVPPTDQVVFSGLTYSNADLAAAAAADPSFDTTIGDLEVSIDVSTSFAGAYDITIISPTFTSVKLTNARGEEGMVDLRVTFSDSGESVLGRGNNVCECLVKPVGPGRLGDFRGSDPFGTWLLALRAFDGAGTVNEWCVGVFTEELPAPPGDDGILFKRGDANNNGVVDPLTDALRLLQWGFGGGLAPPCMCAADVDGNHLISALNDAIRLLSWGFSGGAAPPAPGPTTCGADPQDGALCDLTLATTPAEACGTTTGHGRFCEP